MENEKNLTPEMLEQAKSAPSATALLTLAQENGITLTAEQSATYYAQFHPEIGAISDEELDNVSGGGACDMCYDDTGPKPEKCALCGWTEFDYIAGGLAKIYHWYCARCKQAARR